MIESYSNPTEEGITIHLKKPMKLKGREFKSKTYFISWDKISEALFE